MSNNTIIENKFSRLEKAKKCFKYNILPLLLFFILFFDSSRVLSQCLSFKSHGTLVVGVICNNGIILSSDSRASYSCDCPDSSTTYAYTDSNRKIFPLGKFEIAITGSSTIKNFYWEELLIRYNKRKIKDTTLQRAFESFKKFVQDKLSLSDSIFFLDNRFFLAGYENKKPKVLMFHEIGMDSITKIGERYYSLNEFKPYYNIYGVSKENFNIEVISKSLLSAYQNYSKVNKTIGGPTNIISIDENNISTQISTYPFIRFTKTINQLKAIKKGYRKVYFDTPKSEQFFYKMIEFHLKYPQILNDN